MVDVPASGYASNNARTEGELKQFLEDLRDVLAATRATDTAPILFPQYEDASKPTASSYEGGTIYISDLNVFAYSDGTNWLSPATFAINDAGTGTGEVWSASKITSELAGKSGTGHNHAGVYQPLDATLTALAGVSFSADQGVYATAADTFSTFSLTSAARTFVALASPSLMRLNLGVGSTDSPQFGGINLGHATDTTITRVSAGVIAVEGSNVLLASGIGVSVQAFNAWLSTLAGYGNAATTFANIKQAATTDATGVVEKSTSGENIDGSSDTVYPTVAGVKEMIDTHAGGGGAVSVDVSCAWNGVTTTTILKDIGVSSLTDNGTGDTTVNFDSNFPDANYAIGGMATGRSTGEIGANVHVRNGGLAVGSVRVKSSANGSGGSVTADLAYNSIVISGQA